MAVKGDAKKANTPESKRSKKGIVGFFKDLKAEFKRITWPSKKDFKKATAAVLTFCVIYGIYVLFLDYGFDSLYRIITGVK